MILKKFFFKSINNAAFGKTMENVRKNRNIKLVTTEKRSMTVAFSMKYEKRSMKYLVWKPHYDTANFFTENLLAIELKKTETLIIKLVYLGLSILELSKILMFKFWYDYVKTKIWWKSNIVFYGYDKFIVYIKTWYL